MAKLFAKTGDPYQTPHSAIFDLGLHCVPIILLGLRLKWVNFIQRFSIEEGFLDNFFFFFSHGNMLQVLVRINSAHCTHMFRRQKIPS